MGQASRTLLLGIDENGLGSLLGPMMVTAAAAECSEQGQRWLQRVPDALSPDLDDSKNLMSFRNHTLGEAWARVLCPEAQTPLQLLRVLLRPQEKTLRKRCPASAEHQCWSTRLTPFAATEEQLTRLESHRRRFEAHGVNFLRPRAEMLCAHKLNEEKTQGGNRFTSDLHAMERLILSFARSGPLPLQAICGKVGGIGDYPQYFGHLSGRLTSTELQQRSESRYRFGDLGEVAFVQDADGCSPLVMLASLVGKYLRELTMGRISTFYRSQLTELKPVSGYHDPVTRRFVAATADLRRESRIPDNCFLR